MLGAIIGDMVGSITDFKPYKTKNFNIYDYRMQMTDDSLLTIAVAKVLIKHYPIDYSKESLFRIQEDLRKEFVDAWIHNLNAGFGGLFFEWCRNTLKKDYTPYNSYGNGGTMRISPVAWVVNSEEELKTLVRTITEVTHKNDEAIKGAEAIALCIYLALHGSTKEEIKSRMINEYYPEIDSLDFDYLVKNYKLTNRTKYTVPVAIYIFLISNSLEDTLRNVVVAGGDTDTNGAMAGAIAEAFYNKESLSSLEDYYMYYIIDPDIEDIIKNFHYKIGSNKFNNK